MISIARTEGERVIPAASRQRCVWLRVGTLLDGLSLQPLRNAHVIYDRDEILFVGGSEDPPPADLLSPGQRKPDADLPEFTLLPGLIEAHGHFFLEGGELNLHKRAAYLRQARGELLRAAQARLEKLVRLGIIAVRDAGDKNGVGLALSRRYRNRPGKGVNPSGKTGDQLGSVTAESTGASTGLMPYVDSPGAAIHRRGRYGSFMAEPIEDHPSLRACVESRVRAGAERIKLIPTGIINFKRGTVTSEPQMNIAEIRELVDVAREFGRQTLAHASGAAGIERAIEGGVDSVEHGFFVQDDQLARMRDKQIAWVPTFAPVEAQVDHAKELGWGDEVTSNLQRILDQHARSLVKAHQLGVQIIAGSDAGSLGVPHGAGLLRELELMEHAGLTPLLVVNSATGNSSNRLKFGERFGQIRPGFQGRFILTRHSPLDGISNLRKRKYVVFDGSVLESTPDDDTSGL